MVQKYFTFDNTKFYSNLLCEFEYIWYTSYSTIYLKIFSSSKLILRITPFCLDTCHILFIMLITYFDLKSLFQPSFNYNSFRYKLDYINISIPSITPSRFLSDHFVSNSRMEYIFQCPFCQTKCILSYPQFIWFYNQCFSPNLYHLDPTPEYDLHHISIQANMILSQPSHVIVISIFCYLYLYLDLRFGFCCVLKYFSFIVRYIVTRRRDDYE